MPLFRKSHVDPIDAVAAVVEDALSVFHNTIENLENAHEDLEEVKEEAIAVVQAARERHDRAHALQAKHAVTLDKLRDLVGN